jgi:hypothetical protein
LSSNAPSKRTKHERYTHTRQMTIADIAPYITW